MLLVEDDYLGVTEIFHSLTVSSTPQNTMKELSLEIAKSSTCCFFKENTSVPFNLYQIFILKSAPPEAMRSPY